MHAVILAGGFGTRLGLIAGDKPKSLVEVAGKTILERQIDFLRMHGFEKIRLSLHHRADQIIDFCEKRWPGKIEFAIESSPLGTGGALKYASRDLCEDFLVINGDLISTIDLKKFAACGANTIACSFLQDARDFGLLTIADGKVRQFLEKPKEAISGYVNSGFYLLHPRVFSEITKNSFMIEKEIFPMLAERGELNAFLHDGFWIDVGTEDRWKLAHSKLL